MGWTFFGVVRWEGGVVVVVVETHAGVLVGPACMHSKDRFFFGSLLFFSFFFFFVLIFVSIFLPFLFSCSAGGGGCFARLFLLRCFLSLLFLTVCL
jgi:hypothetical protein